MRGRIWGWTSHRGSVLLLVLVVVALFTLSAFSFFDLMFNYRRATDTFGSEMQATATAESGVEFLLNHLAKTPEEIQLAGGLYDNAAWFRGALMLNDADPRYRARFSILSPAMLNGVYDGARYGLENESARINLNTLLIADTFGEGVARELLMALPGMTELIADAILDWLDEDEAIRPFGAEVGYYSTLDPPYAPANGPLETVEQLLLVRGVTPELLFGADVNRNYLTDSDETGRQMLATGYAPDGSMNRGWSAFLTLHSAESNTRPDGTPKIDVNGSDLEALHADLLTVMDEPEANFIIAFRQGGPYEQGGGDGGGENNGDNEGGGGGDQGGGDGGPPGGGGRGGGGGHGGGPGGGAPGGGGGPPQTPPVVKDPGDISLNFETEGRVELENILDLIGTQTSVVELGSTDPTVVETPFSDRPADMATYLPNWMDILAVNADPTIPGRININQAPRAILYGIPGIEVDVAERIIANRDFEVVPQRPERAHETWILTEGLVTLEEMKELMKFVTGGGNVYRAQVVGFFDQQGPVSRLEVVIDNTSPGSPRVVFRRDLSQLGRGFTSDGLGAAAADVVP